MKRVYLAGPITGLSYGDCVDWRKNAISQLEKWGIEGISPMREKEFLSKEKEIADSYSGETLSSQRGVTTRDRFDAMHCDVLLTNLLGAKKVSIGTMIEYGWADATRTPIVTIIEKEGNPHEHGMIRELTGFRVETLEEGLYVAKTILNC